MNTHAHLNHHFSWKNIQQWWKIDQLFFLCILQLNRHTYTIQNWHEACVFCIWLSVPVYYEKQLFDSSAWLQASIIKPQHHQLLSAWLEEGPCSWIKAAADQTKLLPVLASGNTDLLWGLKCRWVSKALLALFRVNSNTAVHTWQLLKIITTWLGSTWGLYVSKLLNMCAKH